MVKVVCPNFGHQTLAVHWGVRAVLDHLWSCVSWLFASLSVWCRVFPLPFGFVSLVHVVDVLF